MHLHFEKNTNTKCDCSIVSLSWMGKVPDDIPEDDGWKLNRTNYYQEGWLATGNIRGIVGVTFTTSHCKKNMDYPVRTNYNLRGHRSDVILVKWNEPYQKLASCDSSGIIFVWIKYEGRWSIELINDRNTPVTHFSWSHDGRMALICYQDGFVLVGSVAGQRYWSSMLNLESTITCGIWTPDDQQVYFGTTQGQIIVMDVHGAMVSQVQLCTDVGITSMAWSCEKFKMEEGEDTEPGVSNAAKRSFALAVSFKNGMIYLLKSYDDVSPIHIDTEMNGALGFVMEWSNSRELLAVAGSLNSPAPTIDSQGAIVYTNVLKFYTDSGNLLYTIRIPNSNSPVSAITWGHNDKRLFIATGTQVHIAWVSRRVASLQLLCRLQVQACIGSEQLLPQLPLPSRIKSLIGSLFAQTIRCCVPNIKSLREFVSRPPACSTRLHCTMIRHDEENNVGSGTCYTLYLEYLGGLVPLLKGKRTSKIRPEFVIFDPQASGNDLFYNYIAIPMASKSSSSSSNSTIAAHKTDSSDSEGEAAITDSPQKSCRRAKNKDTNATDNDTNDELAYVDTLPEEVKLVEVTSNIWGTKFKIHGLAKTVPANLGQVTYKTSLLHLQPRQMTLVITELRDDFPTGPDPNFNPNIFSEDEDEHITIQQVTPTHRRPKEKVTAPPIAPMSPRPSRFNATPSSNSSNGSTNRFKTNQSLEKRNGLSPLAKAESYEDDYTTNGIENHETINPHVSMPVRPRHIETTPPRPGPSYTSLVTQYTNSGGQSRHAISPLCCEGSVPTLQSPKNAAGPSDFIFERPPATQAISYSGGSEYTGNVIQVKSALHVDQPKSNNQTNGTSPQSSNEKDVLSKSKPPIKKKEINFIDDEIPSTSTAIDQSTKDPIVPITPSDSMTRSCSVGYLDSVEMVPSDVALSILRKEAPNKRLVLVDRKTNKRNKKIAEETKKAKLVNCGKSKSLDSCDLNTIPIKSTTAIEQAGNVMPKLCETPENDQNGNAPTENDSSISRKPIQHSYIETSIISTFSNSTVSATTKPNSILKMCTACQSVEANENSQLCNHCRDLLQPINRRQSPTIDLDTNCNGNTKSANVKIRTKASTMFEQIFSDSLRSSNSNINKSDYDRKKTRNNKQNTEVITSYTDSPLFTRKHRYGLDDHHTESRSSPLFGRKFENGFNLIKQLSEARKRRKEENAPLAKTDSINDLQSTESIEQKSSVSLHAQALNTLENIISRLRDLDDNRMTPPSSPKSSRLPRSSPASPAMSKKGKRNQSSSPIRHILNSPLLNRRQRRKQQNESSDDESSGHYTIDDVIGKHNYRDLETFQKAQLRQKLKRGKIEPNGTPTITQPAPLRREFVMHNKAPMWNENSQVYQLDFGGRVTQESAKNFQIEFRGKQVMQFGRIDGNAYTLDFQYPFSALQAFSVALANVTQRLK